VRPVVADMPIGVVLNVRATASNAVDDIVAQARRAFDVGVRQIWLAQQFQYDAIALAGLVGAAVPGLGVGTFVVPINPRHPLIVATLAQTAQAASHGNFSLGLGLGAHAPEQQAFGTAWPNTVGRLREHLEVLRSIFHTGAVDYHGAEFTAAPEWPVALPGGTPVPVYVAAMGPKALRVTGELGDLGRDPGQQHLRDALCALGVGQCGPLIVGDDLVCDARRSRSCRRLPVRRGHTPGCCPTWLRGRPGRGAARHAHRCLRRCGWR
jgi:alkanesulfonate monooxygenase SsuD/methylene tetrahydromethanopterin reductase-like flavin-dependent oxidoreductase (luciferase family)